MVKELNMTLYQFNGLARMEKTLVIWMEAVLVANRNDEYYKCLLYQLDDFYIELRFDVYSDVLKEVYGFEANSPHIELFLCNIDITTILR